MAQLDEDAERVLRAVDDAGNVAYDQISTADLDQALAAIRTAQWQRLRGDHRYAFLLNAYNLWAIHHAKKLLVDRDLNHKPTWIRFFLLQPVQVGPKRMSLFRLEFQHIRPFLKRDPRGHSALVCASTGCPPLRDGIFHGEKLDQELDIAARAFLQPGGGYRLDKEAGTLGLNRIFKWYMRDFNGRSGVREFFLTYAPEEDAAWVEENRPRFRFLPYDWSINASQ